MSAPLLELTDITRSFTQGGDAVQVLKGLSLRIDAGEFVAIIGQSGSGKSTLMNIIGCLDRASSGTYRVKGRDVSGMDSNALSALRREVFGFVFQRYNLLPGCSACENVEMPALYASRPQDERRARAVNLLQRLGLGERLNYQPGQLSGGQQQRVSIARALMNGGELILADEPTGALDRHSSEEVLALLDELHREGHTVVLITHDAAVAARAERVITLSDGLIESDTGGARDAASDASPAIASAIASDRLISTTTTSATSDKSDAPAPSGTSGTSDKAGVSLAASLRMAVRSLRDNRFRTVLTLLGIIIGVASVVTMLALGNGAKARVLATIEAMGSDILTVRQPPGSARTGSGANLLKDEDVLAVQELTGIAAAVGEESGSVTIRFGEADYRSSYTATGVDKPAVANWDTARGEFFNAQDVSTSAPVTVLGQTVVNNLFPAQVDPVGSYVLIQNVPFLVIGVMAVKGATGPFGNDQDDVVLVPVTTARHRLMGRQTLSSITVKAAPNEDLSALQAQMQELLASRHPGMEFRIMSTNALLEASSASQDTLTLLLASVAAISLLVGGIGVMNIMLVSVVERTREIGIRMACGARRRDILAQFIVEALLVCLLGGLLGVALGLGAAWAAQCRGTAVQYTLAPVLLAFGCAVATGLVFGFAPARKASLLDPVTALASE